MVTTDLEQQHEVVAAVLVRDGQVLLCHRHPNREWYPNVWDLPGGHIEAGERPVDALVRELREELGITEDPSKAQALGDYSPEPNLSLALWEIDDWEGDVINAAPNEHDELAWFTIGQLDNLKLADSYVLDACQRALQ